MLYNIGIPQCRIYNISYVHQCYTIYCIAYNTMFYVHCIPCNVLFVTYIYICMIYIIYIVQL